MTPVNTSRPRNVKVKLKVNSFSIEIESEKGIFLFIPFTRGLIRTNLDMASLLYLTQTTKLTDKIKFVVF